MKTFYFYLLATCQNPKIEVRRNLSIEASSAESAEREILLKNEMLWNRQGWTMQLVSISKSHSDGLARQLEGVPV